MASFYYFLAFCVGLTPCLFGSHAHARTKAMKRATFEKLLLDNAKPDSLATDTAGAWSTVYQHTLIARSLDRKLYERALLKLETPSQEDETGCSGKKDASAILSCAANKAADVAASMTVFAGAVEFRRDAVVYAERIADRNPEPLLDALISLASDELTHGRLAEAEVSLSRAKPITASHPKLANAGRRFRLAVMEAKLADARLDGEAAKLALTEALDVVETPNSGNIYSNDINGPGGRQLFDILASHMRGQFCSGCGEPIIFPVKSWIDRFLSGSATEKRNQVHFSPDYYLMALSAPSGAFTTQEIKFYARRLLENYAQQGSESKDHISLLRPGMDETAAARQVALASEISGGGEAGTFLKIISQNHDQKTKKLIDTALKSVIENSFEQFGSDSIIARHLDIASRNFQAAGHRKMARAILEFLIERSSDTSSESVASEQKKLAVIYAAALTRLASFQMADGDERVALRNLDKASTLASAKLQDEWTYGGAGAILALRDLAPALRLIAQKRSEIVTIRGVSRNAPGHDALFRALQAAMFGETALTLAVADQRRFLSDEPLRDLRQRYLHAVAAAERAADITDYALEPGDVDGALARTRQDAEQRRDALGREFAAKVPTGFASVADIEPVPLAEVSARLGEGEALTLLHVGSHGIHGFLLDRAGQSLAWKTAIKREAVEALVRALRASGDVSQGPFPPFPYADAAKLHEVIFGPVKDRLGAYGRLVIVGDGPLQSMPYGVLLTSPVETAPTTREQMRAAALPWLIRSHALALMPSVRSLVTQRSGVSAGQAAKPFLGIGDPKLADASGAMRNIDIAGAFGGPNTGLADVAMLRKLVSLPETADELRKIAKLLEAPEDGLLLGNRASEKAIRSMTLSDYKIVAFATHGVLAGQVTGTREPGLVLSPPETASREDDGFLALSEIANLRFDADLVMLSACNTGASDGRPRAEGLSGLARGFFGAGARSLLVTHWEIPSDSSVEITTGLIAERAKRPQADWAEAHRAATLAVIDTKGPAEWAHPAYWGGFAVIGVMPNGANRN